jgi:hypothetical protein
MEEYQELSASLADFVREMAFSMAAAQAAMDRNAVEILQQLAATKIKIPLITKTITPADDNSGTASVEIEQEDLETSLLTLGIRPTFYQFSKTVIEVSLDLSVQTQVDSTSNNRGKSRNRVMVNTRKVRTERRYNRNLKAFSKLTLEMVPVPGPSDLPDFVTTEVKPG